MSLQISVFKCQWMKHPHGIEVDEYGFTIVDLRNVGHKDDPWALASTVARVFYILDPKDEKKHIVVPGKQRVVGVDNVKDEKEYNQFDEVPFFVDTTRINIIETKIYYSNVIPYACIDGEGKLVHVPARTRNIVVTHEQSLQLHRERKGLQMRDMCTRSKKHKR
jgi:hypothetical protein